MNKLNKNKHLSSTPNLVIIFILFVFTSIAFVSARTYNSDAIGIYSIAKDIIYFVKMDGWNFPAAPFFFPDILLSIPFVYINKNPYHFHLLTSFIQPFIFTLIYSYIRSKENGGNFIAIFNVTIISTLLIVVSGTLFLQQVKVFYFTIQPFFILGMHGFAALSSITLFLYIKAPNFSFNVFNISFLLLIITPLIISDLYFSLFFGSLLLMSAFTQKGPTNNRNIIILLIFSLMTLLLFGFSYYFNPSLTTQIGYSIKIINFSNQIENFILIISINLILICLLLVLKKIKIETNNYSVITKTLLFISAFLLFTGQITDQYSFRYLIISFPILIIFLSEILLFHINKKFLNLIYLILFISLSLFAYTNHPISFVSNAYKDEIECIKKLTLSEETIIAEYWPAKIIFESLNRQHNLIQVDREFEEFNWVNNKNWKYLYPDSKKTILVTAIINTSKISKILKNHKTKSICNGKILLINDHSSNVLNY